MRLRRALLLVIVLGATGLLTCFLLRDPSGVSPETHGDGSLREGRAVRPPVLQGQGEPASTLPPESLSTGAPVRRVYEGPPPRSATQARRAKPWGITEASRDADSGDLRVRVFDGGGHPRENVRLVLHTFKDRRAVRSHELDLGPSGEGEVPRLGAGDVIAYLEVGDLRRRIALEVEAGRVTELEMALPPGGVLEGQVRHLEKGPQGGVKIQLGESIVRSRDLFSDRLRATTDSEGRYRLEEVPAGKWPVTLQGEAIGHHPRPRAFVSIADAGTVTKDFVLGRATLRGSVWDSVPGRPLPEVRVQLQAPFYVSRTTDANGAYAFLDVPPGDYKLSLSKEGYGHRFVQTGEIGPDEPHVADFTMKPAARLRVTLSGGDGAPVPSEFVLSLRPVEGTQGTRLATQLHADAEGRAFFERAVPGTYDISVHAKAYEIANQPAEILPGDNDVSFVLTRREREKEEEKAVNLGGIVRDATNHRPLPGVGVTLRLPFHRRATSDLKGLFGFEDIPPGPCRLVVFKDGYGIRFLRDVTVEPAKKCEIEVLLEPAVTLLLDILDASGDPVVGRLTLGVTPLEGTTGTRVSTGITADADGRAAYRQILPGRYRLRLIQEGAGVAELEAELRLGENRFGARLE